MKIEFRGTGVAIVTPFKGGKVDFSALENIINYVIDGGVDYIVSLGTTGEAITLSTEESKQILRFTVEKTAGRVPLVAGVFGDNNTARLIGSFNEYDLSGYSAIMSASPAYIKASQEGIYQHYMALAGISPLPIIIYNVPSRTGTNVTADTTLRLAHANDKFLAVKEASGDLNQVQKILKYRPENFLVLSGDDTIALSVIGCGGDGVISVIANALPNQFSGMVKAALEGNFKEAQKLNLLIHDVHPCLYVDGNPPGVKAAMSMMGLCQNELRLPQVPVRDATYQSLKKELEKIGVL